MKKLITLIGSLFIMLGLKAQTVPVKKETTPAGVRPNSPQVSNKTNQMKMVKWTSKADNKENNKTDKVIKTTDKVIKLTDKQLNNTKSSLKK